MSIHLETLIGTLPTDWHLQSVSTLTALAEEHGPSTSKRRARVAVATVAWIGTQMLLFGGYSLGALFLVNNYFGSAWRRHGRWEYWYFWTFVQSVIVIGLLFAIPAVRRAERRTPFGFALAVVAVTLVFRSEIIELGDSYNSMLRPHMVVCFIALGWAAQRARHVWQGLLVTGLLAVTSIGYFGQADREWRIILLGTALIWLPTIPVPRVAVWWVLDRLCSAARQQRRTTSQQADRATAFVI